MLLFFEEFVLLACALFPLAYNRTELLMTAIWRSNGYYNLLLPTKCFFFFSFKQIRRNMIADFVACIESTVWGEVFLLLSIGLELDNFPSHFTEKFWSYICRGYHQMGCFRHRYLVRWWFCRKYTKKKNFRQRLINRKAADKLNQENKVISSNAKSFNKQRFHLWF